MKNLFLLNLLVVFSLIGGGCITTSSQSEGSLTEEISPIEQTTENSSLSQESDPSQESSSPPLEESSSLEEEVTPSTEDSTSAPTQSQERPLNSQSQESSPTAQATPVPKKKPESQPKPKPISPQRYFRPTADVTPVLPKVNTYPKEESVSAVKNKRVIDRSQLLRTVKSDSFYFTAMVIRYHSVTQKAILQFERVPQRKEFDRLVEQVALFEAFFPSKEFKAMDEKKIQYAKGGAGFEVTVQPVSMNEDSLVTLASLLSLLLQRPILVSEESSDICQFSFACDPVMTFSSPNSYGMYTNEGGKSVFFSFNLKNDPEINFRLAY